MEFYSDKEILNNGIVDWNEMPSKNGDSTGLSSLFDNLFGWIDEVDKYRSLEHSQDLLVKEDPSYDIKKLNDGYDLEVERLNAIRQRSSRGFTIIDINPGLLSEQDYPLNIPYEFIFDGTNFIPDQDDSLIKNFRSVPIDIAGDFVKVEYIYENNTRANRSNTNSRPKASIKYQQALKNTSVVNGQIIYSENNLSTGYQDYYFDSFARNKVFLGFGDTSQKPHIISKSGDYFKTYFSSLVLSLNIGAPKIRITIGFNSEKYDGPSDGPLNSQLEMLGLGRLFRESDSILNEFNFQWGDIPGTYDPAGLVVTATNVLSYTNLNILYNTGYNTVGGLVSMGYSVIWITTIQFTTNRTTAANAFTQFNLFIGSVASPTNSNSIRVYGAKLDLINGSTQQQEKHEISFSRPIRVVIPSDNALYMSLGYQASVNTNLLLTYSITGYSYGSLIKQNLGASNIISTSKFITDSTLLSEYNRVDAVRDT